MARRARPRPTPTPPPSKGWWWLLLLPAAVVAVYLPVAWADFVSWDDPLHVLRNACVTGAEGLWSCWRGGQPAGFYPVTWTTFHLEWWLAGGAPWLFHLDNVLLHAASAVLVALLASRLGLSPPASIAVAALWALHPIAVNSVAWVTERKNTLYVCLWLSALLLWLRGTPAGLVASLAVFGLALLSKSAAVTLPAAIVLVEWGRGRRLDRRFWLSLVPFVAIGIAGGMVQLGGVPQALQAPPLGTRLALAARALWFYVGKFLLPVGLVPVYPRGALVAGAAEWLSLVALAGVVAALVAFGRRLPRAFLVGLGLYVVNAAPIVGIVWFTYFTHSLVSDHLAYLPILGLALSAVVALRALTPRAVPGVAVWCVALAVVTVRQLPIWHDSLALWTYTVARNPGCFTCQGNLGLALWERGRSDEAAPHYEAALALERDADTVLGFGNVRLAQGRVQEAGALYEEAMRLGPEKPEAHYNLANVLRQTDRLEEAIAQYREALRLAPASVDYRNNLGVALVAAGRPDEAAAELEQILRIAPENPGAHMNLAAIAVSREDWPTAIRHLEVARTQRPNDPRILEALDTLRRKIAP